jgi:hypothetical protein
MAVRTWVGQFGIVQGQAVEAGPWQGKFGLAASSEDPADLYVLVQPALPGSEEFCGQLVAVVGHLFERQDLSVTGAIIKAVNAAHDNLREWNKRSLREHQVGAGVSCLAVRGSVAYLAQAGPSLAYLRRGSTFMRLVPDDPRATAVVGLGEELRPQLRRYELAPGDLLVVASPSLDEVADETCLGTVLAKDAEEILSELYILARDEPNFAVFVLNCFEETEIAEAVVPPEFRAETPREMVLPAEYRAEPLTPQTAEPVSALTYKAEPSPPPLVGSVAPLAPVQPPVVEPPEQGEVPAEQPPMPSESGTELTEQREGPMGQLSLEAALERLPFEEAEQKAEPDEEEEQAKPGTEESEPASTLLQGAPGPQEEESLLDWILPPEVREETAPPSAPAPVSTPTPSPAPVSEESPLQQTDEGRPLMDLILPPEAREKRNDAVNSGALREEGFEAVDEEGESKFDLLGPLAAAPATATAHDLRDMVKLRNNQPSARHQNPVVKAGRSIPAWALPLALLVMLVAAFAWWVVPQSMEGNRTEKFASLMAEAKADYNSAMTTTDLSEKRRLLNQATSELAQARDLNDQDTELTLVSNQVQTALAQMDAVQELSGVQLLADLRTQVTGDLSLQRLLVGNGNAYLLDGKEGRVLALPLNGQGQAQAVLREGDQVDATPVGRPVQIARLAEASGGSLIVIDSARHLFSIGPDGVPVQLALEGSEDWTSLDAVFAAQDGLYALDGEQGKLWLYPPSDQGFATAPQQMLASYDLTGAAEVAVSGDVYVLDDKGGIRRFSAGQEVAFDMEGIDKPLVSPASMLPLAGGGLLVADRGNKRLVLFAADGRFQQQYVSAQLTNPQAVAVDEAAGKLYVLNGDSLFVADLPGSTPPAAAATATPDVNP